jgi:pimeloyl-ACP methyl ester carboxylesterase
MHRRTFLAASGGSALAQFLPARADAADASLDVAGFTAARRMLDTRFGRIAYVERGRGPAALFLHAYPLNGYEWRAALPRLAGRRRCIAPDFMGLGYSEIPDGQDLSPPAQADMLAALLDGLQIKSADIVANDSGGMIAQLFAARHPRRARSLLLTNCDVGADNPPKAFQSLVAAARAGTLPDQFLASQLADLSLARSQRGLGLAYARPAELTQAAVDYYLRPMLSTPLRRRQFDDYTVTPGENVLLAVEPDLKRFPGPVRIVWGAADTFFDPRSPERLDRTFPNSRGVRRVPEGKLYVAEEFPEVIAEEARALWAARRA